MDTMTEAAEARADARLRAFPDATRPGQYGMTLRDYFAATCAAALVAQWDPDSYTTDEDFQKISQGVAARAYDYADALLAWREQGA